MAEFVELRLEEMLPELEQMKRVQLFTEEEIKEIVKRRRDFEYKLQKRTKQKEDYLKYIQYEVNLLSLLRIRRQKIGYMHKKPEIDHAIANRINKLFTFAISRFPGDTKLWLSHIDFCKRMKWYSSISRVFSRMLALKGNDPSLWILAAKWEFEENRSAVNARDLLLRALRVHPQHVSLHIEAFRLELLETERLLKRREVLGISCEADLPDEDDRKDAILEGKLAVIIYSNAKSTVVKSAADLVGFLTVAGEFDFTTDIQRTILEDMQHDFPEDEVTWDTLARNLLEKNSLLLKDRQTNLKMKERLKLFVAKYEEGIAAIDTPKMWNLFIDTLRELMRNDLLKTRVSSLYRDICERALSHRKISEKHVMEWVDHLQEAFESRSTLSGILEQAVDIYPRSSALWHRLLDVRLKEKLVRETPLFEIDTGFEQPLENKPKYGGSDSDMSDSDDEESSSSYQVPTEFWNALKAVGGKEESLVLWDLVMGNYMDFYRTNKVKSVTSVIDGLVESALSREPPVSSHVKPRALEWVYLSKGLEEARSLYRKHTNVPPLVLEFHYKMIELELKERKTKSWSVKKIRLCYENACEQFGTKNPDLWLRYIQSELDLGDAAKVANLHYRAKLSLQPGLVDQFLTQSTLLKLQ